MAVDTRTLSPFGLGPQDTPVSAHQVLRKGEGTVTMIFPRAITLLTEGDIRVAFNAGPQEVPQHLADHEWLRRNGVRAYDSPIAKQTMESAKALDEAQENYNKALADLQAAKAKVANEAAANANKLQPIEVSKITLSGVPLDNAETDEERVARLAEEEAEREDAEATDAESKRRAASDLATAKQARSTASANAKAASGARRR